MTLSETLETSTVVETGIAVVAITIILTANAFL